MLPPKAVEVSKAKDLSCIFFSNLLKPNENLYPVRKNVPFMEFISVFNQHWENFG